MIGKIFSVLFGILTGLTVYSFVGYMFTKKMPIGKKYKIKMILFGTLFVVSIFLYQVVK